MPKRPEVMTVAEHDEVGDCPIHIRGQIRNLGPKVPRGYLQAAFHGGDAPKVPSDQSGRIQLAHDHAIVVGARQRGRRQCEPAR